MTCPHCQASNPEGAVRCASCDGLMPSRGEAETLAGTTPAATAAAPTVQKASAATGVLSPPPRSGSGTPPAGVSSASAFESTLALGAGAEFGPRYRIESLIGKGGMGRVYRAYDKELDRMVALKLLRPDLTSEPSAVQRFKQELLLASKISHRNILRIHDLGDVAGVKFISMAYVEGNDLYQVLRKQGRLPVDRVVKIGRQLCEALEAAHGEGVVHRDLKPQNVLIDQAGNAYVSDFGLAKSLAAGAAGMTYTGELLGTPRYMSPEQVEGKPTDHRSDLYALGLILYEMATGELPFRGDSAQQEMFQRLRLEPKNPKLLNPDLPDYLARIILRCLQKDPARRYQHAREILTDLEAARAPAPSRSVQISLPMPTRRGWFVAAGALLILVMLALAIPPVRNFILRRPAGTVTPAGIPALTQGKYLAVLPFRVLGDPASLGYVADGLVEALSAKLFQLKDARVASAAAVEKASKRDSLEKTARALGVNLLIHGTVQGTGEKIRIVVNLEDVAGGRRLWSEEFSGVTQDLLTLEDQIYSKMVAALDLKPTSEELARGASHPTENIEAYDLYLKGRNAMRGQQDVKNVQAAIRFYEEALKRDSRFALAYAGVADASLLVYRETKDSFWSAKALAAAQQARALNDRQPEIHLALGSVYKASGRSAEAIAELKRALEMAPNSDEGYRRLAAAYLATGRSLEAIQAYQKAIEINPYYWVNQNSLGTAYFQLGDYEKCLQAFRRVVELDAENADGYNNLGAASLLAGRFQEAVEPLQRALQLTPTGEAYSNLGIAYFYLKRYDQAIPLYEKAVELVPNADMFVGNLAEAYRWAGQRDRATAAYNRAISLAYKDLEVNPRDAFTKGRLALWYAKKGDPRQALKFVAEARAIDPADVQLMYFQAQIFSWANDKAKALGALREAFGKGLRPAIAEAEPDLQNLHTDSRFQKLVKEFTPRPD